MSLKGFCLLFIRSRMVITGKGKVQANIGKTIYVGCLTPTGNYYISKKGKKTLFLTLKSRIRVWNLTCWKTSETQVRPELTLETELQTFDKNLSIAIHLMHQTEKGKQNKTGCNLFIVFDPFFLHGSTLPQGVRGYYRNYPSFPTISTQFSF